jgi:hypothetical protein
VLPYCNNRHQLDEFLISRKRCRIVVVMMEKAGFPGPRRAYHFLPAHYALEDLRHRRMKIALLDDLNDPFDLWAVAQPDPTLRKAMRAFKLHVAQRFGMVCFSLAWHNPLLWSHYADKHRGVALG